MYLIDAIRHHAKMRPYDLAIIHSSGAANYLQLAHVVTCLSLKLRSHGLSRGATIAVYVTDPFLHLAIVLAAMLDGVVSVSAHPNYDPLPSSLKVDAWLADRKLPFEAATEAIIVGPNWLTDALSEGEPALAGQGFAAPDSVGRMYTSSGTTGLPKVIAHSIANLEAMALRGLALDPLSSGPHLCMMWLSTIGGFGTVQSALWHGTTLVLLTAPLAVLRAINLHRVAALRASPQQLQGLVELVRGRPVRFPSLQKIEVGGASTPTNILLAARATLCPNVIGIYGSTEAGLVAQAPGAMMYAQPDAAGYVVPGAQVRIVDEAGHPVGLDVEGVVQLRTPYMVDHYHGDEAATAAGFRDGWFIPGDLGVMRPGGLLRITGRADEMINAGGVKLSPVLIDEFLLSQPGVRDAAAFAYRRSGRSDEPWAAVVCTEGFDEQAVMAAARARLNSRAPVRLLRVSEIPRNAMGKALRQQLSAQATPS